MLNNKEIIKKLQQGNSHAFETLYKETHTAIYRYIFRFLKNQEESENILQDVYVSVWEMRKGLDDSLTLQSLLYKIAKNKVLNYLRKTTNENYYINYIQNTASEIDLTTEMQISYNELSQIIRNSVKDLPDRRREIFLCSLDEGLSYKEISKKLNISENTVDTQIRNALDHIRTVIRNKFQ